MNFWEKLQAVGDGETFGEIFAMPSSDDALKMPTTKRPTKKDMGKWGELFIKATPVTPWGESEPTGYQLVAPAPLGERGCTNVKRVFFLPWCDGKGAMPTGAIMRIQQRDLTSS